MLQIHYTVYSVLNLKSGAQDELWTWAPPLVS